MPVHSARLAISSLLTQTYPGAPLQQSPQPVHWNLSPSLYQGWGLLVDIQIFNHEDTKNTKIRGSKSDVLNHHTFDALLHQGNVEIQYESQSYVRKFQMCK